jgi:hypothetical protein
MSLEEQTQILRLTTPKLNHLRWGWRLIRYKDDSDSLIA